MATPIPACEITRRTISSRSNSAVTPPTRKISGLSRSRLPFWTAARTPRTKWKITFTWKFVQAASRSSRRSTRLRKIGTASIRHPCRIDPVARTSACEDELPLPAAAHGKLSGSSKSFQNERNEDLQIKSGKRRALHGYDELAEKRGSAAPPAERLFGRDARDVRVVVVLGKMREDDVSRVRVKSFRVG